MRFVNATLGKHRHVCAFFNGTEEEYRVLLPFVKEGLARGEKAFHIARTVACDFLRAESIKRLSIVLSFDKDRSPAQPGLRAFEN